MNRTRALRGLVPVSAWGALWGVALGFWLLAPRLAEAHRMAPAGTGEWIGVCALFLVVFAMLGGLLGVAVCLPFVVAVALRRGGPGGLTRLEPLALPPLLILGYFAAALLIEWRVFRGLPGLWAHAGALDGAIAALAVAAAALAALRRRRAASAPSAGRPAAVAAAVAVAAIAGAASLPARVEVSPAAAAVSEPELVRTAKPSAPVLLVGIDSADWRLLRPLVDAGRLPTLGRLEAAGIAGTVDAAWPPYWSAPAWAAILTGHPRESAGIYEDLVARAPGVPPFQVPLSIDLVLEPLHWIEYGLVKAGVIELSHPPREALRRAPVWERLTRAGVSSGVVRFRFTFPADGQARFVVSDWVGDDQWNLLGIRREAAGGLVAPAASASDLLEPFSAARRIEDPGAEALLARADSGSTPDDAVLDPTDMLRFSLDIDHRTVLAAERILSIEPGIEMLAVYLGGLDTVCHAFWQYRFPGDFPDDAPAPGDVERLGPVIDAYLELLDRWLDRLVSRYERAPNVVVVSDHGHGPNRVYAHRFWRGWHDRFGVFLAAGPDVPRRADRPVVSYLDVAPTLLDLLGFEQPADLVGASLLGRAGG